jgi:hypothetical protein
MMMIKSLYIEKLYGFINIFLNTSAWYKIKCIKTFVNSLGSIVPYLVGGSVIEYTGMKFKNAPIPMLISISNKTLYAVIELLSTPFLLYSYYFYLFNIFDYFSDGTT